MPKDSTRLSISGCAHGRVFTVGRDPEHESRGIQLEEGMKIRLEGQKQPLADIKAHPAFKDHPLVRVGRLSVVPLTAAQWAKLLKMGGRP